jgi:hypothetical protein
MQLIGTGIDGSAKVEMMPEDTDWSKLVLWPTAKNLNRTLILIDLKL